MSPLESLHCRRFLSVLCLSVAAVGCAGAKRHLVSSTDAAAKSPFQLASHPSADANHGAAAAVIEAIERDLTFDDATATATITELPSQASLHSGTRLPRDATSTPDSFRDLTESEMLALAFAHSPVLRPLGLRVLENPEAAPTIYDAAITASDPFFGPDAALAEFDNVLEANVISQNNDRVFNNRIEGGNTQQLVQDLVNTNAGWQRRHLSGAIWDINHLHRYNDDNRKGNTFNNYWETYLEAGVRQPLLQGAGRNFNSIAGPNARPGFNFSKGIIIARLNNRISDAEFVIQVRDFVQDLYTAYWDLDRQYRNYENVLKAQEIAYRTWQTVLAKSQADVTGGEANKEAQARARYYSYRREVQVALGGQGGSEGLYVAERRVRLLIGLPIVDGELLRPGEEPAGARFVYDYDLLVSRGMAHRTELRRQGLRVRQQELRLVAAKNFLLPRMDLIGRYRLRGFGDDLFGDGPRFSSAYQDFFSFDHQEWEFGLEMGVVAGRRQAHAAVRNATLQLRRDRAILVEQQRSIRHDIGNAYAEVASSYASMETSQAQVDASRQRLESSEALFEADKIQIEFLLDAQEELLRAQLQLATDVARYTVSLINVNAAAGSLLDDIGVYVRQTACRSKIIFLPQVAEGGSVVSTEIPIR